MFINVQLYLFLLNLLRSILDRKTVIPSTTAGNSCRAFVSQ